MSSSDVRSGGYPTKSALSSSGEKRGGDPGPRKVHDSSGKEVKAKDQDKYTLPGFQKNFFLTMQGPGRPALVPFQPGLRPRAGEGEGAMWWDNVPDGQFNPSRLPLLGDGPACWPRLTTTDASGLMAPPVDESKLRAMMKNPWAMEMLGKDLELLKLKKKKMQEEECVLRVHFQAFAWAKPGLNVAGHMAKSPTFCRPSWACCYAWSTCAWALVRLAENEGV